MSKRSAALAALLVVLGLLVTRPAQAAPVRIMTLGDSITGSPGCWRALLWNRLQSNGFTNIDMVGTLPPQGCSVAYDGDNEGHGGALVTNVADQNQLPGWLSATRPDIVLMHFGTNDVWSNKPTATVLAAYGKLVDQMRAGNPNMRVLVAKIIPMNPGTCPECGQRVVDLNNAIPGWAAAKTTAASPIQVVDQWTGFSTSADTYDGVHPNASGDQKMADRWYPALAALLGGGQPSPSASPSPSPSPSPSASPSRSPSPSPSPSASPSQSPSQSPSARPSSSGCAASYVVTNQWGGGFQAEVTVKNTGTAPISGWTVTWTFANGQQVSQAWNGTVTQSGANVTAKNVSWNGSLAAGATTTLGFLASWNGVNSAPAPGCVAIP
ncbi:cellulose binding domain-containing protein [Microbispora triticiradicis]|uniref:Cellulose-binding protein n=2 Tax=Microbispora TaxID=2005 RepID=A0ABY3M1Q5_9ACTN|nr:MULTISPECIES: cellulose binding domain-containing protein [Microbispora]TLP57113.1 cellulose-binding protein [Microbispora fusca]TYB64084.1 cellulose-binding protein [Microbispora tritici]